MNTSFKVLYRRGEKGAQVLCQSIDRQAVSMLVRNPVELMK
jgi:hypothetical protein